MSLKKFFQFFLLIFLSPLLMLPNRQEIINYTVSSENDFYINSRQNIEALDGLFNIFPKPVDLNQSSEDKTQFPMPKC